MSAATALLRATSIRFTALYFLPYCVALTAADQARWQWIGLGIGYWFLHGLGTEALNRLADRVEDEVNRPERTALCHRVGFERIKRVALYAWLGIAALDILILVLVPDPLLALYLVLAGLSGVNYSYGLRLARNRLLAPLLLTFHFGGTFLVGWVLVRHEADSRSYADFTAYPLPFFVVGMVTLLALGGAKDLTDLAGDARIGYHSAWVGLLRRSGAWLAALMVASTYVLTVLFVATGLLPGRFLLWLALTPVAALLGICLWRASTAEQRLATREFFYQYWMLVLPLGALLYAPTTNTAVAVLGSLAFWWWATQRMHWSSGVRRATLRSLAELIVPSRFPPVRAAAEAGDDGPGGRPERSS